MIDDSDISITSGFVIFLSKNELVNRSLHQGRLNLILNGSTHFFPLIKGL